MGAPETSRLRRGIGIAAAAIFVFTAGRAFLRMGPVPDGTCAMSPTCPNPHQWAALLVLAVICLGAVLVTVAVTFGTRGTRRSRRPPGAAVALAVAVALTLVDVPGHLNSPHADWFGHSLGDGALN